MTYGGQGEAGGVGMNVEGMRLHTSTAWEAARHCAGWRTGAWENAGVAGGIGESTAA